MATRRITAGDAALQRARRIADRDQVKVWRAREVYRVVCNDKTESFGPGFVVQKTKPLGIARYQDLRAEGPFFAESV